MKILNQTYRDVESQEVPIMKTPVSDLTLTTELKDESLLHIVQYITGSGPESIYESMKMNAGAFKQKVYEAVQNTLHQEYWDLHSHVVDDDGDDHGPNDSRKYSFKDMLDYLGDDAPSPADPLYHGEDKTQMNFVRHINYDFEVLRRYIVKKDDELANEISLLWKHVRVIDTIFAPEMIFTTEINRDGHGSEIVNESVNHKKTENHQYCQMQIQVGNKISNEWRVPATGELVVYGWLDSTEMLNNKATPSAFCVLEAKIENKTEGSDADWEIIGVQSVQPAKNITYVGFTVPAMKNLLVRVRTGFTVGAKSGQFSNEQDGYDTISNATPNGFKCMVYSNKDYVND